MGRKLDALNAIAAEQGYTGDEPTSVVGAINAIVDAMGGDSSAVGIADAITALAPYIGGGGGVDVGALHLVLNGDTTTQAGDELGNTAIIRLAIGDSVISNAFVDGNAFADGNPFMGVINNAAEGATVDASYASYNDEQTAPAAVFKSCTIDTETFTYVTFSNPIEVENTTYAMTEGVPNGMWVTRFVMPELPVGSALFVTRVAP